MCKLLTDPNSSSLRDLRASVISMPPCVYLAAGFPNHDQNRDTKGTEFALGTGLVFSESQITRFHYLAARIPIRRLRFRWRCGFQLPR